MSAEELFEVHESDEYLEFDRIPEKDRLHKRMDLCAFLYIANKFPEERDIVEAAGHDKIYLGGEVEALTEEDVIYLLRCGVTYEDGLMMHV